MSSQNYQIELYLNSKYASSVSNGSSLSDLYFYLKNPIVRQRGYLMSLRLVNFVFPLSMYLVDQNSNSLIVSGVTYTIPSGNYTVTTLQTAVLSVLPTTYSMSYNSITNKFTFTNTTTDFSISNLSTCMPLLGFSQNFQTSSSKSLTSDLIVNLSGSYNTIYVDIPNISTQNISSTTGRQTTVIKSIPVPASYGGIQYWEDSTAIDSLIQEDKIDFIHVRLLGEDLQSLVNFNGQNWNMTLCLHFQADSSAPANFKELISNSGFSQLPQKN